VIYTLEQVDGKWMVSKVQIEGAIPAWESAAP